MSSQDSRSAVDIGQPEPGKGPISTLHGRLVFAFAVLVILFGANAAGAAWAAVARARARANVITEFQPAARNTDELYNSLVEEESGYRGFQLTGDPQFLQPYDRGRQSARSELAGLHQQLVGHQLALALLQKVESAATAWGVQAAQPGIASTRAGAAPNAALLQNAILEERLFDTLRAQLTNLSNEVNMLLTRAQVAAFSARNWLNRITVVTFAVAFALIITVSLMLRQWFTRPLDQLVASLSTVASGDLDRSVTTSGPREFRVIAAAAEKMRRRMLNEAASSLQSNLVEAQEAERRRIAAEIHDDSVQAVTAVSLRLQRLRRRLTRHDDVEVLHDAETATAAAVERLRRLIFELHPPNLEREGLAAAVELYGAETFDGTGTTFSIDAGLAVEPRRATQILAYRLSREALSNVRAHSGCHRVAVTLGWRNLGIHGCIRDDGDGFDAGPGGMAAPGHVGLVNSEALARAAGGWWRVRSARGMGTAVEFWVPDLGEASSPKASGEAPGAVADTTITRRDVRRDRPPEPNEIGLIATSEGCPTAWQHGSPRGQG